MSDQTEYEVEILRRRVQVMRDLFWQVYIAAGGDPDTDDPFGPCPPEGVYTPDIPELALDAVKDLRRDYEGSLDDANNKTALILRAR